MKITELNGRKLKSLIEGCTSAGFIYHNKHKDGSGNFGIYLDIQGNKYRLDGEYNSNKTITSLRFGKYGGAGVPIPYNTIQDVVSAIKEHTRFIAPREIYPVLKEKPYDYGERLKRNIKAIYRNYKTGLDRDVKAQLMEACDDLLLNKNEVLMRYNSLALNKDFSEHDILWILTGMKHYRNIEILPNAESIMKQNPSIASSVLSTTFKIASRLPPEYKRIQIGTIGDFYGKKGRFIPINSMFVLNVLKR